MTPSAQKLSAALASARQHGTVLDAREYASAIEDAAQAYDVQDDVFARTGELPAGVPLYWKSGGPSRSAPLTHAPLPPRGVRPAPAAYAGAELRTPLWIEAEIALRLRGPLTAQQCAGLGHEEALAHVEAMAVSIELVASRWQQALDAPALLRLADLQSHEGLVLGEFVAFGARDWSSQPCVVEVNGRERHRSVGSHLLGTPTWGLAAWLRHVTRRGDAVPAGAVVTTGTWCGALPVQAGDRLRVAFEGIGEATVQF
jgi:2-keto-4-pentenoate hydratase/2-oxohepta-3-ene-1,7-dioic acid hydratase in catechol pathway